MFEKARAFFRKRNVLEVDCPALDPKAPVDLHIDVMKVSLFGSQIGYLHTSPEYGMKRLLAEGIGDIYQISHVFRDNEIGSRHHPEFTMAEWYRCHFSMNEMIQETCAFLQLFLQEMPIYFYTYQEVFQTFLEIDPFQTTQEELFSLLRTRNVESAQADWDRDTLLQLCMSLFIEPMFKAHTLTVVTHFPPSQAALAKVVETSKGQAACRFEIFCGNMELANGYHELSDPEELQMRFEEANILRLKNGKDALPIDHIFLEALRAGFPDCCGVAVGFDRLMMLRHGSATIKEILPHAWEEAPALHSTHL